MRLVTAIPFALLSLIPPALADGPSFDCDKAAAPAEHLICADSELVRLDGLMGETYNARRTSLPDAQRKALLDQQRDWLKTRLTRCGIPTQGGEPNKQQHWAWASCLADRYRERLAVLGVNDPVPQQPNEAGFIHPLCLLRAVGSIGGESDATPTALQACNTAYHHIPVEKVDGGGWSSPAGGVFPESVTYEIVGKLPSGHEVVEVHYWGGGTGQFSSVFELTRKGDTLIGTPVAAGGDRCNGGISSTELVNGSTIRVTFLATASELFSAALQNSPENVSDGLPYCAVCCYGTITQDFAPEAKTGQLVSVTVDGENETPEDEPKQLCLDRVLGITKGKSKSFTIKEMQAYAQRYIKECVK